MKRFAKVLLLVLSLCHFAVADELRPSLDNESFSREFVGKPPNGDKLIEYVREGESFEKWTKLIGYRYQQLPGLGNDPVKYATFMAQMVKRANPQANSQIIKNEQSNEAVLDFLTWPRDAQFMEFNVFRFWKSKDGKAVVSLQLSHRFEFPKPATTPEGASDTERKGKEIRERRAAWIKHAVEFDTKAIETQLIGQQ